MGIYYKIRDCLLNPENMGILEDPNTIRQGGIPGKM